MDVHWENIKQLVGGSILPELEKELGIRFPASYVECVMKNNGGDSVRDGIFSEELDEVLDVRNLLRIDQGKSNIRNVYYRLMNSSRDIPSNFVPFAKDSFGNFYCFAFKGDAEPEVIFWNHDFDDGDITTVASSFDDFLNRLLTVEEADELERRLEKEEEGSENA